MAYQFTQTGQEIQYLLDEAMQLAEEYDSSVSYAVGDYCSHEGTLYRCTTATTGTWDASKWTDNVIVLNALKTLKGRMDTAEGNIQANADDISALNQSLTPSALSYTFTAGANVSLRGTSAVYKSGNIIHIGVYFDATAQLANNATICTVSGNLPKPITSYVTAAVHGIASTEGMIQIERGDLTRIKTWGVLPAASYYYAQFCYMAE